MHPRCATHGTELLWAGEPITPITLPSGNVSATFPTTNFLTTGGMLPPGLTLAANGALTGVPTAASIFDVDIAVTDANNATGTRV